MHEINVLSLTETDHIDCSYVVVLIFDEEKTCIAYSLYHMAYSIKDNSDNISVISLHLSQVFIDNTLTI